MTTPGDNARPWTSSELAELEKIAQRGVAFVARTLKRSQGSVRCQAARMRISLRRRGSRAGLLMGQPRDVAIAVGENGRQARALVLAGVATIEDIAAGVLPMCPRCGANVVSSTGPAMRQGLCLRCYWARRASAYAARFNEAEAEATVAAVDEHRRADVLKQRRHRALEQQD